MKAHDKTWDHIMQAGGYLMGGDYIACHGHLEAAMKMLVLAALEKNADEAEALGASVSEMRESIAIVANGAIGIHNGPLTINNNL